MTRAMPLRACPVSSLSTSTIRVVKGTNCFGVDLELPDAIRFYTLTHEVGPCPTEVRPDFCCRLVHRVPTSSALNSRYAGHTHPFGPALRSLPSMMCMNFRWFKFPCCERSLG